ncbi:MAG: hypothetical protein ABI359_11970, partial [Ginsengibacter sp.]
ASPSFIHKKVTNYMNLNSDVGWWSLLAKKDQLEMAILLCKNAMPVWKNYDFPSSTGNSLKGLPIKALITIEALNTPDKNIEAEEAIKIYFTAFVTPFIQIQDGGLDFPYAVKSSFLSVFYILKGLLSKKNSTALEDYSTSISKSLDAIYISKMMTISETEALIEKYFLLSLNQKKRETSN